MVSRLVWFTAGVAVGLYVAVRGEETLAATAGQSTAERMAALATDAVADLAAVAGRAGVGPFAGGAMAEGALAGGNALTMLAGGAASSGAVYRPAGSIRSS